MCQQLKVMDSLGDIRYLGTNWLFIYFMLKYLIILKRNSEFLVIYFYHGRVVVITDNTSPKKTVMLIPIGFIGTCAL